MRTRAILSLGIGVGFRVMVMVNVRENRILNGNQF
jgi:hypothetical protein